MFINIRTVCTASSSEKLVKNNYKTIIHINMLNKRETTVTYALFIDRPFSLNYFFTFNWMFGGPIVITVTAFKTNAIKLDGKAFSENEFREFKNVGEEASKIPHRRTPLQRWDCGTGKMMALAEPAHLVGNQFVPNHEEPMIQTTSV